MTQWFPSIPTSEQTPAASQPFILINNQNWPTLFNVNHGAMNSIVQGQHEEINFKQQSTDPIVTQDLGNLYCKSASNKSGSALQLFWRMKNFILSQPNNPEQITFSSVSTSNPYQSFLIGGYVVYMGTFSLSGAGSTVTVSVSPTPTALLSVITTITSGGSGNNTASLAVGLFPGVPQNFQITLGQSGTVTGNYLAIGTQ